MSKNTLITELDLVDKICDFIDHVPERNEWNENSLLSNPPRLIRYKRIKVLIKAYLGEDIKLHDFIDGNFIKEYQNDKYKALRLHVKDYNKLNNRLYDTVNEFQLRDVQRLFYSLLDYRLKINIALCHNSGWLVASGNLIQHALSIESKINKTIRNSFGELNQALSLVINPTGLKFTEAELIEKYGYPNEDLDEIDFNWL